MRNMEMKKNDIKVLVTGGYSQLALCIKDIIEENGEHIINKYLFPSHSELDITNKQSIEFYLDTHKNIKYIINCASYTNVEEAENDIYSAFYVNSYGVKNLVDVCEERDITLIHISTDYVYKDNQGIIVDENGIIDPINIYGQSKRDGEIHIEKSKLNKWFIIRTSWLYSEYKSNFLTKILRKIDKKCHLFGANNEIGCPTYAQNLGYILIFLVEWYAEKTNSGIYNYCDNKICSRYEFIRDIISYYIYDYNTLFKNEFIITDYLDYFPKLDKVNQEDIYKMFDLKANRPKYLVMNCNKIKKALNIDEQSDYYESLEYCIRNYINLH